jgi:hypothetical protein
MELFAFLFQMLNNVKFILVGVLMESSKFSFRHMSFDNINENCGMKNSLMSS